MYDDPNAHAELETVVSRLRDTAREVNIARDDPVRRRMIQTTWLLQDRLTFDNEVRHGPESRYRMLTCVIKDRTNRHISPSRLHCVVWGPTRCLQWQRSSARPVYDLPAIPVLSSACRVRKAKLAISGARCNRSQQRKTRGTGQWQR